MTDIAPTDLPISELYATHRLRLVRMAVLLVDDRTLAEDIVQDAFLALHRNADRLRVPEAAAAYLQRSVLNGARSTLRRRQTVRRHQGELQPGTGEPADAALLLADEHREILAAVQTLPARSQQVLLLRYWSQLSEQEIAETLGISRGTVRSTASRALDRLESIMEAQR